jgi:predicted acylesterase/phospholipase RssA
VKKIGLALSGGGFRASLYHLGLVRFLRDAGLLSQVSHITAVSGGSIIAAHMALNWDRYNGSPGEFDAAATELLAFVRLDVRNRILRRFLLTFPVRWPRRLLGWSNRKLSRTGLLEYHYERYLYGDKSLFELPEKPQLHLLATNLSEGCLCSFTRDGLLMVRRQPGNDIRIDRTHLGLATVAMAVTASSAFPGFFPPLELTGAEVGASAGEFGRQAYTDGGVFDNLGVRMFRCLERPLLIASPLTREDFFDFQAVIKALHEASTASAETPLRRLAQVMVASRGRPEPLALTSRGAASAAGSLMAAGPVGAGGPSHLLPSPGTGNGDTEELVMASLWDVMRHCQFHRDPLFASLKPVDADAELLLHACRVGGRDLDAGDQVWLNRHLLEAAFRQATGQPCFRRLDAGLDGVLVSDVGKPIEVLNNRRAGGLIRTALRASDILMDRVWQLEIETFKDTRGFVFAPITDVVEPAADPTALHPELQRQTANIRTDLDRFSPLEISSLVRHGYCVGRKACRTQPELFGNDLPGNAPWDPTPLSRAAAPPVPAATRMDGPAREPTAATVEARTLQASAIRRIWSTLLDYRDWVSYVYVPIIIPILVLLPLLVIKAYQRSHRLGVLMDSLSHGSRDLELMSRLLDGPMPPWTGVAAEEVPKIGEYDFTGFQILQDSRILDLRRWKPGAAGKNDSSSQVFGYRRLKVLKKPDNTDHNIFRVRCLVTHPEAQVRFPQQRLQARLRRSAVEVGAGGEKKRHWEASYDFHRVPAGEFVDVFYEHLSPGEFLEVRDGATSIHVVCQADTAEVTRWILMPEDKEYRKFRILRYKTETPDRVEPVQIVTEYLADDLTILAYKLLSIEGGYTYELTWYYK